MRRSQTSKASESLHERILNCLLEVPMRFFDTNPSGRVLRRFSRDTGAMAEILPKVLIELFTPIVIVVLAVIFCCIMEMVCSNN